MKVAPIVGHVGGRCKREFGEQEAWRERPVESSRIKPTIDGHVEAVFRSLERKHDERPCGEGESGLRDLIFCLA
jgi:hypothetical protein